MSFYSSIPTNLGTKLIRNRVKILLSIVIIFFGIFLAALSTCYDDSTSDFLSRFGVAISAGGTLFFLFNVAFIDLIRGPNTIVKRKNIHEYFLAKLGRTEYGAKIRILTTFINIYNDREKPEKKLVVEFNKIFRNVIENKGSNAQILILDPICFAMRQRCRDMFPTDVSPLRVSVLTLNALNYLQNKKLLKNRDKIRIKVFQEIPPFILYQIDSNLSIRFFPKGEVATKKNSEYFTINDQAETEDFFGKKFEEIWNSKKFICSLDEYLFVKHMDSKIAFVDVYDEKSGEFCDNRLIACNSKSIPDFNSKDTFQIIYRGIRKNTRIISFDDARDQILLNEISIKKSNSDKAITTDNKIEEIDFIEFLQSLWKDKFYDKADGGNYYPNDFEPPIKFKYLKLENF